MWQAIKDWWRGCNEQDLREAVRVMFDSWKDKPHLSPDDWLTPRQWRAISWYQNFAPTT